MNHIVETANRKASKLEPASLHLRGTMVVLAATVVLTGLTGAVCHGYLTATHSTSPLAPVLIFGAIFWLWWGAIAVGMWWLAQRWPSILRCTTRSFLSHIVIACVLGLVHLALLQQTVNFANRHWQNDGAPP